MLVITLLFACSGPGTDTGDDTAADTGADADADGYTALVDCDDGDAAVHPDANEVCNGIDDDCDDLVDDADPGIDASTQTTGHTDVDLDGYGSTAEALTCGAVVTDASDCDDSRADVHPGAEEVCDDADDDCDGVVDWDHRVPTNYSSVQEAVNAVADGETVCVEAGTFTGPVRVQDRILTIAGTGESSATTLDGEGRNSVVTVTGASDLTLEGLTLTNGRAPSGAGIDIEDGTVVTLRDVVISGNTCSETEYCRGIGLKAGMATLTLEDVVVSDNIANTENIEGAAYTEWTDATITTSRFEDNRAEGRDETIAGLVLFDGTTTLRDVSVTGNVATGTPRNSYGGLVVIQGTHDIAGLTVSGNVAETTQQYGSACAGVFLASGDATLRNALISGNTATDALAYATGGVMTFAMHGSLTNVIVAGNTASGSGGAVGGVWVAQSLLTIQNTTVYANSVTVTDSYSGYATAGGIACTDSTCALNGVSVTGNTVTSDITDVGGITYQYADTFDYVNSWGNSPSDWNVDPAGENGTLSVDPLYADTSSADPTEWDLNLQAGSPLIDAGDPALFDPDGSRSDIGAWGGPGAADW